MATLCHPHATSKSAGGSPPGRHKHQEKKSFASPGGALLSYALTASISSLNGAGKYVA
jgi:hypothetical protein